MERKAAKIGVIKNTIANSKGVWRKKKPIINYQKKEKCEFEIMQ